MVFGMSSRKNVQAEAGQGGPDLTQQLQSGAAEVGDMVSDAAAKTQAGYTQLKDEADATAASLNATKSELEGIAKSDAPLVEKVMAVLRIFAPCLRFVWRALCCRRLSGELGCSDFFLYFVGAGTATDAKSVYLGPNI